MSNAQSHRKQDTAVHIGIAFQRQYRTHNIRSEETCFLFSVRMRVPHNYVNHAIFTSLSFILPTWIFKRKREINFLSVKLSTHVNLKSVYFLCRPAIKNFDVTDLADFWHTC